MTRHKSARPAVLLGSTLPDVSRVRNLAYVAAMMTVALATMAPAAPVPFTGTLVIDLSPSGGNVLSIPGGGVATFNQASNIVWPVTRVYVPIDAFRGTAGVGLIPGPFGATVRVAGELLNQAVNLRTMGTTGCTLNHPKVSCPGVGLAGIGAILGYTPPQRWSLPGIYVTPYGASPVVISTAAIGSPSSTHATGLFLAPSGSGYRTLSIQKGGWTTGRVRVFGSNSGTSFFVRSFSGSQGANSLSIVSPVAVTVVSPLAGIVRTSAVVARMTLNLSLSCGDGLISMGEICDDGGVAGGDGCDASCMVEPGYVCQGAPSVCAPAIGVGAKKLIVIDKLFVASKAKAVYVSKDPGATKGVGVDAGAISVAFDVAYDGETGRFDIPTGVSNGTQGWVVNKTTVAKYVNKAAPAGSTAVKVAVIKPAKLLKLVAKERGDADALDILAAGPPAGSVFTSYCVANGGETNCHCTEFSSCTHRPIGGGTGAKLVCKNPNVPDPTCTAVP